MASYVGSGLSINSTGSKTTYVTGTDGGASYTVGSGANRALLIVIHGLTDTTGGAKGASSVTHNGQSAVKYGGIPALGRTWIELWYVLNPTTGAGGTTVVCNATNRALRVTVAEATDADQTTPIHATSNSSGAGGVASRALSLTTTAANSLLLMGVAVQSGAGTFSTTGGGTLATGSGQTGTSGFSDVSGAVAYKAVAASGSAETLTISWVNSNDGVGLLVEVLNASGGGVAIDPDSAAYTQTANSLDVIVDRPAALAAAAYTQTANALDVALGSAVDMASAAYTLTANSLGVVVGSAVDLASAAYTQTANALDIAVAGDVTAELEAAGYTLTAYDMDIAVTVPVAAELEALSYTLTANPLDIAVSQSGARQPGGFIPPIRYVDRNGNEVDLDAVAEKAVAAAPKRQKAEVRKAAQEVRQAISAGDVAALLDAQFTRDIALISRYLSLVEAQYLAAMAQERIDDETAILLLLAA
ncbi:MAG: hypothetical protein RL268_484 [Pseudomonadota bacterium]